MKNYTPLHYRTFVQKGNTIIKSMNNNIQGILPNNVKTKTTYTGWKRGTKFQIKDPTKIQHGHNLIYYSKFPEPNCLGETERRRIKRKTDHYRKYKQPD